MGQHQMPPRRFSDCWFAAATLIRLISVIHEVDSALRALIDREAGIRDVDVVFDAPTRDWASRRTTPTVDVYLYDIREDLRRRERGRAQRVQRRSRPASSAGICRPDTSSYPTWSPPGPNGPRTNIGCCRRCWLRFCGTTRMPADLLSGPLAELGLPVPLTVGLAATGGPRIRRCLVRAWAASSSRPSTSWSAHRSTRASSSRWARRSRLRRSSTSGVSRCAQSPSQQVSPWHLSRSGPRSRSVARPGRTGVQTAAAEAAKQPDELGPNPLKRLKNQAQRWVNGRHGPAYSTEPAVDERAGVPAQTIRGPSFRQPNPGVHAPPRR